MHNPWWAHSDLFTILIMWLQKPHVVRFKKIHNLLCGLQFCNVDGEVDKISWRDSVIIYFTPIFVSTVFWQLLYIFREFAFYVFYPIIFSSVAHVILGK